MRRRHTNQQPRTETVTCKVTKAMRQALNRAAKRKRTTVSKVVFDKLKNI